ncbi:MAG TPA: DNA polymerase III subunit alpha, partial [Alphaproteobacteria bacterium]|nr:DNA polymerase III subunit alpha [Alphaproteobacteria bacterium]
PIRFGLLFERFLNPERVSMPDFDIDFCQERRGEVIDYVQQKYGNANVAQIITFGKLQARAVLKDVGRVLQVPYSKVDRICKLIPFNPIDPVTLEKAIELDPALKQEAKEDEAIAKLLDIGLKLEGMHRHASTHAAGVVIGSKPLMEILPLYTDHKSSMPTTQYAMKYSEAAGLVKFDFLGLKTLTLISKAVKMIKENEGVEIDIDNLTLDDKKTFEMLARGSGVGVFQMESAGMRDSMRKMKLDSIEDIIALISLYRPGPMENIPLYIACKLGKQKPDYLHPMLETCLKETYGVIIYQEQVMQIAQILAGYSLGGADLLRRAMGKKIKAEMDAQRELFVNGAVKNNVLKAKAEEIFDLVAKFAGYGFNKSHAAAYAVIGYQTAYLKAHYPAEFYCASMNQDIIDTDKILVFKEDVKRTGIKILPPDINKSYAYFTTEKLEDGTKATRYALGALKGVGIDAIEIMIKERTENGTFKDLSDFINRASDKVMNKRQLESLTLSGAFDVFDKNRKKIFEEIPTIINYSKSIHEEKNTNQVSLFGLDEVTNNATQNFRLREIEDFLPQEKIFREFEAIGFYLDKHPVDNLLPIIPKNKFTFIEDIEEKVPISERPKRQEGEYNYKDREKYQEGYKTLMIGVANKIVHRTRGGKRFAFFLLSDPTGMVEVNMFNEDLINSSRDILKANTPMVIETEIRRDEGGVRIIASKIHSTTDYFRLLKLSAEIFVTEDELDEIKFKKLKTMLANDNAEIPVTLSVKANNGINIKMKLPTKFGLNRDYFEMNDNEFEMKIIGK